MASLKSSRTGLGLALLAVGNLIGAGAQAQTGFPTGAASPFREDPAAALARHLKALSDSPRSVGALMGAGKAALELGDAQAAVTFFARAEEIEPRNGRIKAGIGSALLMMEQPHSALKFFADASALGAPEVEIARDRGLAYDLTGDPRRAQKDYALVLARSADPEVQRRLALSRAITGDKSGALQAIDDQLRRQDKAAWRTRAFVLALTGDSSGAVEAVNAAMPGAAAQMQPFLAKLPGLKPAERAMAVHFGHFPGDPQTIQMADASTAQSYSGPPSVKTAGRPDTRQSALGRRAPAAEPVSTAPRRRPGTEGELVGTRIPKVKTPRQDRQAQASARTSTTEPDASSTRIASAALVASPVLRNPSVTQPPVSQPSTVELEAASGATVTAPATTNSVTPAPGSIQPVTTSVTASEATSSSTTAISAPDAATISTLGTSSSGTTNSSAASSASVPAPALSTIITTTLPASAPALSTSNASGSSADGTPLGARPPANEPPPAESAGSSLAEIAAAIAKLTDEPAAEAPKPAAPVELAKNDAKPVTPRAAKREEPKPEPPKPSQSSRHWVQIASAPDNLVESEYRRLKRKHSKLLSDKEGYRAPMGKSNRVLVGPFASAGEAKTLVGQLKGESLTAITWTSANGQEIDKITGK